MRKLTLVTGNAHKADAWRRLMPASVELDIVEHDLTEIQFDTDYSEVVRHKAHEAYNIVGAPVLVEDVSAGLDAFDGLPGPYIKAFIKKLGASVFYDLAGHQESPVSATCRIAYYDGEAEIVAEGTVRGLGVNPRGTNGFGFDAGFQPDGYDKTFAEMSLAQKDPLSHRGLAIIDMMQRLGEL